ncbi:MAG: DUF4494 domain-containing protein [Paludibacter sp.]|jgi:hypothetical protein|nr:DUF4494 domain-containing protein [Paludibacter sp.]
MKSIFLVDVKYDNFGDEGNLRVVSETHMVDAISHTEAEARIVEEMRAFINGEFQVVSIKRARISEIFTNDIGGRWYRCKVIFIELDEEKGVQKKIPATMMVQAVDIEDSIQILIEAMKGTMADWELAQVTETKIHEFFKYDPDGTDSI